MFQGTGSDVGKSLIVAGLARAFADRGLRVRPFKPQNMSNNAAVTADGGEIGRAQALQARAAKVAPSVHMNPVLLKPQSNVGSQVIVQGRVKGSAKARDFQAMKPELMASVLDSFRRLGSEADLVVVEGAGSASEINLRQGDIAYFAGKTWATWRIDNYVRKIAFCRKRFPAPVALAYQLRNLLRGDKGASGGLAA